MKRPEQGLLAGQWEFPSITLVPGGGRGDDQDTRNGEAAASAAPRGGKGGKGAKPKPKGKKRVAAPPQEESEEGEGGEAAAAAAAALVGVLGGGEGDGPPPFALLDRLEGDMALAAAVEQAAEWRVRACVLWVVRCHYIHVHTTRNDDRLPLSPPTELRATDAHLLPRAARNGRLPPSR